MSWFFRILIWVVCLVLPPSVLAEEWYKEYAKGQDAVKDGDCARAQTLLLQALQQNSTTGLHVPTYGTMRMEYIPHYYLAECAFRNGDIEKASVYIKEAETDGAASSSKASEFAQLKEKIKGLIEQKKKEAAPAAEKIEPQKPIQAAPQEQRAAPKPTAPQKETVPSAAQQAGERQSSIGRALKEANDQLAAGRYDAARGSTNRVLLIDPNNSEAQRILSQISVKEAEDRKKKEKDAKFAEINRSLNGGDWAAAESLAMNLKSQYPSDSAVQSLLEKVQKQKEASIAKKTGEEERKTLERNAVIAYYRGDYEKSIEYAQQALVQNSDNWRLHFFMGCSYAALALLQDDNKEPRLDLAKQSFRKARSLSRNLTIPPYISPKILDIYRSS